MKVDYRELLQELWHLVGYNGFVSTCLELKEGMLFYERDLLLAAYASGLETIIVSALYWACLDSVDALEETASCAERLLGDMPGRLLRRDSPIDVQALVESFLATNGWVLVERLPIYIGTFVHYGRGDYNLDDNPDHTLRQVQLALNRGKDDLARELFGALGATVLRGERIRPCWCKMAHPRLSIWLKGLDNMVNALKATTQLSFPFEDIDQERRRKHNNSIVIDLEAFRNLRRPGGFMVIGQDNLPPQDEVDKIMADYFFGEKCRLPWGALKGIRKHKRQLTPLLLAILENELLREREIQQQACGPVLLAIHLSGRLRLKAAVDPLITILTECTAPGVHLVQTIFALERMVDLASGRLVDLARERSSLLLDLALADILEHASPCERVYEALATIWNRNNPSQQQGFLIGALVNYGDPRALSLLEEARKGGDLELCRELNRAIAKLRTTNP
ncbi:MAG: hypothetical protein ACOX20_03555 [Limnochordia bacterium]